MKTSRLFILALAIVFSRNESLVVAQDYSINWHKVSGGGGASRGASYSLAGTIGQHDAGGPMSGGNYSIMGGYWALAAAVQTPGLPDLTISLAAPNSVIISWPNTTAATLQQNTSLAGGTWVTSGLAVTTLNGTNRVTITAPSGNLFFRLKR